MAGLLDNHSINLITLYSTTELSLTITPTAYNTNAYIYGFLSSRNNYAIFIFFKHLHKNIPMIIILGSSVNIFVFIVTNLKHVKVVWLD